VSPGASRARGLETVAGLALAAACAVSFAPWPDDWDGLGFLASIRRFDMASFSPHPPGYPVYVLLLKLAAMLTSTPIGAARVVGSFACLVTYFALARAIRWNGPAVAAFVCVTPLVFRCFSGVGSEGPALAFAAVALLGVRRDQAWLTGVAVGLGLGVRLSWAPLYVPMLFLSPTGRARTLVAALVACLAWAIPLVALTGAAETVALARTHLSGHMTVWGGTALTESSRFPYLARDVLADGFGGRGDVPGAAILIALSAAVLAAATAWIRTTSTPERWGHALRAAAVVSPYTLWVVLGQNLHHQPRHVVPLVALFAGVIALSPTSLRASRGRALALGVLGVLMLARTATDAVARSEVPPPGAQLLAYLREQSASLSPASTAVFAGASGRFLDGTEWQPATHAAATMGDALLSLSRSERLPEHLLVTNELTDLDVAGRRGVLATFCRPPWLDRRLPCLELSAVDVKTAFSR
jgi:hypothetical protein